MVPWRLQLQCQDTFQQSQDARINDVIAQLPEDLYAFTLKVGRTALGILLTRINLFKRRMGFESKELSELVQ